MTPLRVNLGTRSYTVEFGPVSGIAQKLRRLGFSNVRALIVTTQAVKRAGHAQKVSACLKRAGFSVSQCVVPNGEQHKTLTTLERLYRAGFKARLDRRSLVVGVGGGV